MGPPPGADYSMFGGYLIYIQFNQPVTFTGIGSATLYDVTASTSTSLPLGGMSIFGGGDYARLYVDNGPTHSPAHTYSMEVSSDLITGYAGIGNMVTWTWLR